MLATLRIVFWVAAVFFAITPVFLGVVASPDHLNRLFSASHYVSFGRDLIFVAIAILAIGLIDALEVVLLTHHQRKRTNRLMFSVTVVVVLAIVLQLFMYASWSTHLEGKVTVETASSLISLTTIACATALLARVNLIVTSD